MNLNNENQIRLELNLNQESEDRIIYRLKSEILNVFADKVKIKDATEVMLKPKQVAEIIGVSITTIYKWIKIGKLIPIYYNTRPRFRKSEVLKLGKYGRV